MMESLTKTQAELLAFMVAFQDRQGFAPTFRQMADALGLASTSGVHRTVMQLEKRGVLVRPDENKYRHPAAYEFVPIPPLPKAEIYLQLLLDQLAKRGEIKAGSPLVKRIRESITTKAAPR